MGKSCNLSVTAAGSELLVTIAKIRAGDCELLHTVDTVFVRLLTRASKPLRPLRGQPSSTRYRLSADMDP